MKLLTLSLSLLSILVALLLFGVSVAGAFWPATPANDPGMLSTAGLFLLMGLLGLLLLRVRGQQPAAPGSPGPPPQN